MPIERISSENLKKSPLVHVSLSEDRFIYPGPHLDCSPMDHKDIQIFLLGSEYQVIPGYIVVQCKESHGTLPGYIPVPDEKREEIIESINKIEKIILDEKGTPGRKKMIDATLLIEQFIGDVLNPELQFIPFN